MTVKEKSSLPHVAIIGTGLVGSTLAYTLLLRGPACRLTLIDQDEQRAEGHAMDLVHGIPLAHPLEVAAGSLEDCADADVIVIAAGVGQRPGETRLELLGRNSRVMADVVCEVTRRTREAILLVLTNPVDVLTYVAWKVSGLDPGRVIGSGTILDTARLRYLVGRQLGVDPRSVHAFVIGEHGDSEVAVWSRATVAGISLGSEGPDPTLHLPSGPVRRKLFDEVRTAAYQIIARKGATYFAIALGAARILESILHDQRSVLTVSTLVENYHGVSDLCIGVPAVVGRRGVERVLRLPLEPEEAEAFRRSAQVVGDALRSLREAGILAAEGSCP